MKSLLKSENESLIPLNKEELLLLSKTCKHIVYINAYDKPINKIYNQIIEKLEEALSVYE